MNTNKPIGTVTLLQKGIAAARAGRSHKARQLLEQVIATDPNNEMAWLWLSGLMATNEQKRACLQRVLQANPENVYARAGLKRLPGPATVETDLLETRLKIATDDPAFKLLETESAIEPQAPVISPQPPHSADHTPTEPAPAPNPSEVTCPICEQPVSPEASECPHCHLSFDIEELLARGNQESYRTPTQPLKPQRKGILGLLGTLISS